MSKAKIVLMVQGTLFADGEEPFKKYQEGTGPLFVDYAAGSVTFGLPIEGGNESYAINAAVSFPEVENPDNFFTDPRYAILRTTYRDKSYEKLRLTGFLVDGIEAPGEMGPVAAALLRDPAQGPELEVLAQSHGGHQFMNAQGVERDYLHDAFAWGYLWQFPDAEASAAFAKGCAPMLSDNFLLSLYNRVA